MMATIGLDGRSLPAFPRLNYWRIKAPRWIRNQEVWEQRDFGDKTIKEPEDSVPQMERAATKSKWPPIVWLEELDKFQATKNRLRNLYCLVDFVYEKSGTIITTSNLPLNELRELIGEPIYRRISGDNDDPQGYLVWDFFKLAKKPKTRA
jgi:hypothetical protein